MHSDENHRRFMDEALSLAESALERGEFPVGCVIVSGDRIVSHGARQGSAGPQPNEVDHAELIALRRLSQCPPDCRQSPLRLYSTLEPCLMCYGALLISGIDEVVYSYEDAMGGGTRCDLAPLPPLYRQRTISLVPHVRRRDSLTLFKAFFSNPANTYWKDSLLARYTLAQRP